MNLPIFLVNDGSLTKADIRKIKKYFSIINPSDVSLTKRYQKREYPHFYSYRMSDKTGICKKKFDAYLWNPFAKSIAFDSDILFYRTPTHIIDFIQGNTTKQIYFSGRDASIFSRFSDLMGYEYTFRKLLSKHTKHIFDVSFNSGLMCIQNRTVFNIKRLDTIFKFFDAIGYTEYGMADETALCLLWSHTDTQLLPPDRYMMCSSDEEYNGRDRTNAIAIHYMGLQGLKNQFYSDAIRLTISQHFFRSDISIDANTHIAHTR